METYWFACIKPASSHGRRCDDNSSVFNEAFSHGGQHRPCSSPSPVTLAQPTRMVNVQHPGRAMLSQGFLGRHRKPGDSPRHMSQRECAYMCSSTHWKQTCSNDRVSQIQVTRHSQQPVVAWGRPVRMRASCLAYYTAGEAVLVAFLSTKQRRAADEMHSSRTKQR